MTTRHIILLWGYILFFLFLLALVAHAKPIGKYCPMPSIDQRDKQVGAGYNILAHKYWRTFDLDGDFREDYHVEYDLTGVKPDHTIQLSTFPSLYYRDTDGDGVYDQILMDTQGNGNCADLRPYIGRETTQ